MLLMAIASVLVGIQVSSIYYMIPSLLMFGLSNPLIHTPLMPEMGTIVSEMVRVLKRYVVCTQYELI